MGINGSIFCQLTLILALCRNSDVDIQEWMSINLRMKDISGLIFGTIDTKLLMQK